MADINTRIFGAPIPEKIKNTLEQRQLVAGNSEPNQPIDSIGKINFPTEKGSLGDLSSKTPFARMWVCVELHDSGDNGAIQRIYDYEDANLDNYEMIGAMDAFAKSQGKKDYTEAYYDKERNKFYVYGVPKEQLDANTKLERTIYTIGNHVLNTEAKSPNEQRSSIISTVFPQEHQGINDNNKFLKPQSGITSISSETRSASTVMAGALKETRVNFTVHNFHDFDKIYNKFFLKPGARVFLDFGWDVNDLYDIKPDDMKNIQENNNFSESSSYKL